MNKEDINIGDLFYLDNKRIFKVTEITENECTGSKYLSGESNSAIQVRYDDLKPIPITEPFLNKNDWKALYKSDDYTTRYRNSNSIVSIEYDSYDNMIIACMGTFGMKIEFVHQLQHLLKGIGENYTFKI